VDEAYEKCGGFGRFQKISAVFLILCMSLSQCFLYSFPFLELIPKFECRKSIEDSYIPCGAKDVCALKNESLWRIIWEDRETVYNLVLQLDLKCESEMILGLFGSLFLAGIVLGSVTLTRIGDTYGRKHAFGFGLIL
jgi:hypothetical protein